MTNGGSAGPDDPGPDTWAGRQHQAWFERQLAEVDELVARARDAVEAAQAQLAAAEERREVVLSQLVLVPPATPTGPSHPPPAPPPELPRAGEPETSTRTVQNILFVLGGLLLGTAAIAFTAVAWATFGETGRAVVLAVVTLLMLAIPLVALARGLRATAETFAAVGLLLVVLDGYALWYIDIAGVQSIPGPRYAGLVALVTAVVALAYRTLTRLTGPAFPALVAAQFVLPLIVAPAGPGLAAQSLVASAVALVDLLVVWLLGRIASPRAGAATVRALAWLLFGIWAGLAALAAVVAEIIGATGGHGVADVAPGGAALVLTALVLLGGAVVDGRTSPLRLATAALVPALAVAIGLSAATALPGPLNRTLLVWAAVAAGLSLVVAVTGPALPVRVRPGPRAGAQLVAGVVALVAAGLVVTVAATTVARSLPVWSARLRPTGPIPPIGGWELPVAAAVAGTALVLVSRRRSRIPLLVAAGLLIVLSLPGAVALPWWTPAPLALVAAAVALAAALAGRTHVATGGAATCGAVLVAFALSTALARPALTAGVLLGLVALGAALAASATRLTDAGPDRLAVGGGGLSLALVALPAAIGSLAVAADRPGYQAARVMVGALALVLIGVALVSRPPRAAVLRPYALAGVLVGAVAWPAVAAATGHESLAVYAGVSLLVVALAVVALPAGYVGTGLTIAGSPVAGTGIAGTGNAGSAGSGAGIGAGRVPPSGLADAGAAVLLAGVPGAVAVAGTAGPAVVGLLARPYAWLGAIWAGAPVGVGIAPPGQRVAPTVTVADAIAVGLVALASASVHYGLTRRVLTGLGGLAIGGPTAIILAVTAAGASWPAVPAAMLLIGLVLVLVAGIARLTPARTAISTGQGLIYAGAGVAASLGERWTTLTALGALVVTATVLGSIGRTVTWRLAGLLTAVGAGVALAASAGLAADLAPRQAAFAVLLVAIAALFAGALLGSVARREVESRATEAAAQAAAVVALLLTVGFSAHAATICVTWGVAVGLRALLPATARPVRARLAAVAGAFELLAWWLLLAARGVTLVEAYTLPLALVALLAGFAALRARSQLGSWVAYGPALAAAFAPSLAAVVGVAGDPWRRLALGTGAIIVVVLGSMARLQAPVVIGGVVLAIVALHELVLLWQLLPGWIPLAAGGVVLLGLAITYERRRRDLSRLRAALARMS